MMGEVKKMMAIIFVKYQVHTLWSGDAAVERTHQGLLFRRTHVSFKKGDSSLLFRLINPNLQSLPMKLERWENTRAIGE